MKSFEGHIEFDFHKRKSLKKNIEAIIELANSIKSLGNK